MFIVFLLLALLYGAWTFYAVSEGNGWGLLILGYTAIHFLMEAFK